MKIYKQKKVKRIISPSSFAENFRSATDNMYLAKKNSSLI